MVIVTWAIIFALIAINALYVAAEFAAVSVRRSQMRTLAEGGNRRAAKLVPILENTHRLDRYIAACQIGITFSSLVLGAFGQSRLAAELVPALTGLGGLQQVAAQSIAAGIVLAGLTAFQVVLGELVPKSLALQYPVQTALLTALPMRWSESLYSWFIATLNGSGNLLLRLLGFSTETQRHIHSPEEIELLLAESRKGGLLELEEHRRLLQALRLGGRTARQIMVPRREVEGVDITLPADEIVRRLVDSPYTRLPVYRESLDNLLGLIHTKDLVARYLALGEITSIEPLLRPVLYVPESFTVDRLLALLREKRQQQAIVVDEFGGIEGLVTLEDVLTGMLGELTDEFKVRRTLLEPQRLADGRVRLPGKLPVDQAESWTGVRWSGESETVGGRVIEALGHLPATGERVTVGGAQVEVERVKGHVIETVVVTPLPHEEDAQ